MNHESISWSHKLNLFFFKYIFKIISTEDICLFICLDLKMNKIKQWKKKNMWNVSACFKLCWNTFNMKSYRLLLVWIISQMYDFWPNNSIPPIFYGNNHFNIYLIATNISSKWIKNFSKSFFLAILSNHLGFSK